MPVSGGAGGAGVQDAPDGHVYTSERPAGLLFGEAAHADDVPGLEALDGPSEGAVTNPQEGLPFGGWQFVGRAVPPAGLEKREWAVVGYEEPPEKTLRRLEVVACPGPETCPADLAPRTGQSPHRPLRVFGGRSVHRLLDAQPVADGAHFAKGHPGLDHTPRAGIHAEQDDLPRADPETFQITPVGRSGIGEGIVHIGHRRPEAQTLQVMDETVGDLLE